MVSSRGVLIASVIGTVLQVAMVVVGHSNESVKALFAVGGMGISLIAGLIYAMQEKGTSRGIGGLAAGGALAGGICAFIGILVSHLMGDVPASLLALGTISSVVTGAIGGSLGKFFGRSAAAIVIIASLIIPPGHASAQTTTRDLSWLTGRWQGTMAAGDGVADVTFAPPVAGLITGVMRLVSNDKILVVELISIVDTPAGPEMRFRHFSSALEAYEGTFKQILRLKTSSADKYVFENLVPYDKALMSTQPRVTTFERTDADSFTGHSDIIGQDGKPAVVEVKYRRISAS